MVVEANDVGRPAEASSAPAERLLGEVRTRRVAIVIHDGILLLTLGASSAFSAANRELATRGSRNPAYGVVPLSPHGGLVTTTCGIEVNTRRLAGEDPSSFDILVVGGGNDIRQLAQDREIVDWLRRAAMAAERVISFGGGAFLLAKTGLLDGKQCATHWRWAAELQREHPQIRVRSDALFVRDGRWLTAAGSSGSVDVALAIVEEDFGRTLAMRVARALVLPRKRPGDQPQVSAELQAQDAATDRIAEAADWIVQNLDKRFSVGELAGRFAMSERNFSRRFGHELGMSPQRFIDHARLEAARRWLVDSALPIDKVARRTGYSDAEHLKRAFGRQHGMTPLEYRERSRAGG